MKYYWEITKYMTEILGGAWLLGLTLMFLFGQGWLASGFIIGFAVFSMISAYMGIKEEERQECIENLPETNYIENLKR